MLRKTVLLYYPPNRRSIAIESLCNVVREAGHELIVLTLTGRGPLHETLEQKGIKTYTHQLERKGPSIYFARHALFLARFCRQHKVDVVWSHLQEGNFIAVIAQPFLKAKVTTFRHHAESAFYAEFGEKPGMRRNKKEALLDKILNKL